jgi:diguanylate cyclase (GGDEF)-like protein
MRMTDTISLEIAEVQSLLKRGGCKLTLAGRIESLFKQSTEDSRRRGLIVAACVGLAIFDISLAMDYLLIPDVVGMALLARLGIVTPLAVGMILCHLTRPAPWFREMGQCLLCLAATAAVVWLCAMSHDAGRVYHHYGIIEIMLYAAVVQRLRFGFAAGLIGVMTALHLALVLGFGELPLPMRVALNLQILACGLTILVAAYAGERWKRTQFLLTHLDTLRANKLEYLARFDVVTGLANRHSLDEYLRTRPDGDAAVLLIDVDHFKLYNDHYGHPGGDQCLRSIGEILGRAPLDRGIVARYGGEEFIVILGGAASRDAAAVAEGIRARINAQALPHEGRGPGAAVTVSIGVAAGPANGEQEMLHLIRRADTALYGAKAGGRDQVCLHGARNDRTPLSLAS